MIFARLFVVAEGVVAFMMFSGVSFILQGCEQVDEEPLPESLIRNPTDWEPSCAIQTAHAKASTIVYGSDDLSSMEREGWQRLGKYTVDPWWTKDEADLWERSGECILAFRGSDDLNDVWNDLVNVFPESYHGVEAMGGVKSELEHLLGELHSKGARELVSKSCDKGFVAAGHSLGGALAQLFAVLVNKNDNPLEWNRKVDAVYPIGSMPVGHKTVLTNDQSPDGTFKGTNLFNSLWHPEESRMLVVDFTHSLPSSDFKHIKMKHEFFMTSGGDRIIVPASEQIPADITLQGAREYFGIAVWEINELHSQSKYIDATSECGA